MYLKKIVFEGCDTVGFQFDDHDEMQEAIQEILACPNFLKPIVVCLGDKVLDSPFGFAIDDTHMVLFGIPESLLDKIPKTLEITDISIGDKKAVRKMLDAGDMWFGFKILFSEDDCKVFRKIPISEMQILGCIESYKENARIFLVDDAFFVFVEDPDLCKVLRSEFLFEDCAPLLEAYCSEHGKEIEFEVLRGLLSEDEESLFFSCESE